MSENTPDRLQAFREENVPKAGSRGAIVFLVTGIALGAAAVMAALYVSEAKTGRSHTGLSADRVRELALLYEAKDMPQAAIEAHTAYLEQATLSDTERGDIAYSIAKLAVDNKNYEQALEYLYRAEHLAPESVVRDERSKSIVYCLDQLGRTSDLRRELKQQTDTTVKNPIEPGAVILAEFGNETITDRDLEQALSEMPQSVRSTFTTSEKQVELLQNLVAERLLLDKAFRLKLEEDEDIQAQIKSTRDSLLVRKLMEDEVQANISITPEDVQRYYNAEQARFTEPETARVLVANADTESEATAITDFNGQPIPVRRGERLGRLPNSPEVIETIFNTEVDATTAPIAMNDRYFVFKVVSKTPERIATFDEVKAHAERALRGEKEREHLQLLIEETLRTRNAKLYPDRLKANPAP